MSHFDIVRAVDLLTKGEVVAIPTETVYGLAANAFNADAIKRIYTIKGRPTTNPLILHVKSVQEVHKYVDVFPTTAFFLAERFWPGPLTMVFKKNNLIDPIISAGTDTVAIRVPQHPYALELLKMIEFPLVAPSANLTNRLSPTIADHVRKQLGDKIPFILDGGECKKGIESTIIGFHLERPVLLRKGAIPLEEIEKVIGKVDVPVIREKNKAIHFPGDSLKHYSPLTPLVLTNDLLKAFKENRGKKFGVLSFTELKTDAFFPVKVLSPSGDYEAAAQNLYRYLHELDEMHLDVILAELLPDEGLGKAINDRLLRAGA